MMPAFVRNADDRKARAEGAWRVLKHEAGNAARAAFRTNPPGRGLGGRSALSRLLALPRAMVSSDASRGSTRQDRAAGISGYAEAP
jgi:hypothetical protein